MAASRRGQPELHVRLPSIPRLSTATTATSTTFPDLPPISALFLIDFDVKAGYTISWKASTPAVDLEEVVEYKSLPSGLHTVSEDLIYFVHDDYAGLSAFVNAPVEDSAARNARMLAVGVLVPLSYGRLGRAWKHAEGLKTIASTLATTVDKDTSILEQYWQKHRPQDPSKQDLTTSRDSLESPISIQTPRKPPPKGHARNRSASDGAALIPPGHRLSPFHPAWSLTRLLDTFGPLIFPIHRAALLRKRILISGHAPVQEACNFVYDISVLSNIPLSTFDLLSSSSPPHRLRPLFSIGVHDIPFLADDAKPLIRGSEQTSAEDGGEKGTGWIACTTDSILSKKDELWDVLITMPPSHASNAKRHVWPTVEYSRGITVKATQRDSRRYRNLRAGLARIRRQTTTPASPTTLRPATHGKGDDDGYLDDADQILEPLSWTALAYSGFMWWASAGEQARSEEAEESAQDASLLADLSSPTMGNMSMNVSSRSGAEFSSTPRTARRSSVGTMFALPTAGLLDAEARVELAIIAYFHRFTTQILTTLADVVESSGDDSEMEEEGDDEEQEEEDALIDPSSGDELRGSGVRIGSGAVARMGLDIWSASDAEFLKELLRAYFARKAYVEGKGVEVCGVRVC